MYITMCLYITITILLWVLSIYPFIKHYTIVISMITIQFSHIFRKECGVNIVHVGTSLIVFTVTSNLMSVKYRIN